MNDGLTLLIRTSNLEFRLKRHFRMLLATKEQRWQTAQTAIEDMLRDLAHYFSGSATLSRVEKDASMEQWFTRLANEVESLDYSDATLAGRKIQQLLKALQEVEQFEVIDTSTHIKEYLSGARDQLTAMVRTVNIQEHVLQTMETVSDMSYAWHFMRDFIPVMHQRIRSDPNTVVQLRAVFIKLTSVLDIPLVRISQVEMGDTYSVAEFYSSHLVRFVRDVMAVIPHIVFEILRGIINLQTEQMRPVPPKFELHQLQHLAQVK